MKPLQASLPTEFLHTAQAAELLRLTEGTLRQWRCKGIGPPYFKLHPGKRSPVIYDREEVLNFIREGRVVPSCGQH